jgi:hypothetical protein
MRILCNNAWLVCYSVDVAFLYYVNLFSGWPLSAIIIMLRSMIKQGDTLGKHIVIYYCHHCLYLKFFYDLLLGDVVTKNHKLGFALLAYAELIVLQLILVPHNYNQFYCYDVCSSSE